MLKKYGSNTPGYYPSDKYLQDRKLDKHTNVMESFYKHHSAARCHALVQEFLKGLPAVNRLGTYSDDH